ncbi:hypothetical protein Dimus_013407 [Dionaea muscipula]
MGTGDGVDGINATAGWPKLDCKEKRMAMTMAIRRLSWSLNKLAQSAFNGDSTTCLGCRAKLHMRRRNQASRLVNLYWFPLWPKQLNVPLEEINPELADIIKLEKAKQWKGLWAMVAVFLTPLFTTSSFNRSERRRFGRLLKYLEFHHPRDQKLKADIRMSIENFEKKMSLVTKDVDTLTYAIQEKIPKCIATDNDYIEKKIAKAEENLGQKIDENSSRLSTVEETLASLLKAQQE